MLSLTFHSVFRCLEFLLDNGGNPTLKNSKGYSAVHYAAACGNKQHLELVSTVIYYLGNWIIWSIRSFLQPLFQLLEISFNCLEEVESNIPVSPLHLAVSSQIIIYNTTAFCVICRICTHYEIFLLNYVWNLHLILLALCPCRLIMATRRHCVCCVRH